MEKSVLLDLANETARRYGELAPDFADKMAKRMKRKFAVKIESQKLSEFVLHYREIYEFAKSTLRDDLKPPKGEYADSRDVDVEKLLDRLVEKFPDDDVEILQKINGWVVYYEYLR